MCYILCVDSYFAVYFVYFERIGLRVHRITSDIVSLNIKLWKTFNIQVSRHSIIINSSYSNTNSNDKNRRLYFFHDVAHTYKNLKIGLLRNKFFTLPKRYNYSI